MQRYRIIELIRNDNLINKSVSVLKEIIFVSQDTMPKHWI